MNVLFYVEPWISRLDPYLRDFLVTYELPPLCKLINQFKEESECFFLIGDAQKEKTELALQSCQAGLGVIHQKELRTVFSDSLTAECTWYDNRASDKQEKAMQRLVLEKLGGFVPDIIIAPFTSTPYLQKLFPEALPLHGDCGYFARTPFAYAYTLDPCGMLKNNFLGRYAKDILNKTLSPKESDFLKCYRKKFLEEHMISKNPFSREYLTGDKKFRHLILLPLTVSRSFAFCGSSSFEGQWEMLCHVLDALPDDIGVVVTQHFDFECTLTPDVDRYLRETYPNYIYNEDFSRYPCGSQYLLHHVDAVAAVTSSICYQALLWKKPVCALGDCQINEFADAQGIEQLVDVLEKGNNQNKDALLYFILTHFNIPVSPQYFHNKDWLENRLLGWLNAFRKQGIDKNFFKLIDDPDILLEYFIKTAQPEVLCR